MHEMLWAQLEKLDMEATARRAICTFNSDLYTYTVRLIDSDFSVDVRNCRMCRVDNHQKQAAFLEQLCILAYLINATDTHVAGRLVGADKLDSGQFFFRGPHELPTSKLEQAFGDVPGLLYEAAKKLNAERCEYGDASITLRVLPRLPVVFVVWARDDEFDARASILFDETADRQLPLDAIGAAVQLAVARVTSCIG